MLLLYNLALLPLRAASAAWGWRHARHGQRAREWAERRARVLPRVDPGGLWIHGASAGEARLVRVLASELRPRHPEFPLSVSAVTPAGRALLDTEREADAVFFLPLDFPGLPGRVLDALRPAALVLVETELWPNLLHEASGRGIPVILANGRLAPERMTRYRRLWRLYGPLLAGLAKVGAQSRDDAARFLELGVPQRRLEVTGNLKYDLAPVEADVAALRERFGLDPRRPVLVAGSTGADEEGAVLEAWRAVRARFPQAWLVLAPRHVARADGVEALAASLGLRLHRLSREQDHDAARADGLLVDRMGELGFLYALAAAAFVGGSLVPVGGHNVLEPAALGVPVLFGPHTHHVEEPAAALLASGGAVRVGSSAELAAAWSGFLEDEARRREAGDRAAGVVRRNRGALGRTVRMIESVLGQGSAGEVAR